MNFTENEIKQVTGQILIRSADLDTADLLTREPDLKEEVERRLDLCGMKLIMGERPFAAMISEADQLSEASRAALAVCAIALNAKGKRPRIEVEEIRRRVGPEYTAAYVRRAVLGPLEARSLIKVIKPDQRAQDAYVVAGPGLAAIDSESVMNRLKASVAA